MRPPGSFSPELLQCEARGKAQCSGNCVWEPLAMLLEPEAWTITQELLRNATNGEHAHAHAGDHSSHGYL